MFGGDGDDILYGEAGSDQLFGDAGNDTLYGGDGVDFLYGGDGDDVLYGGRGNDFLYGNDGDDILYGEEGDDELRGGAGNDQLFGGDGDDLLYGGRGDDILEGNAGSDTLYGGDGNDILYGHSASGLDDDDATDYLYGEDGNDILYGNGGNDFLYGGAGDDRLYGGDGDDYLEGNDGNDILEGNAGSDTLYGGAGNDRLYGHSESGLDDDDATDYLYGEDGIDFLYGNGGDDFLYGGAGNDFLFGGTGEDTIFGEDGDDYIEGGAGSDLIYGGDGNDTIYGFGQDDTADDHSPDTIYGGRGNDRIYGNGGDDIIYGEEGDDTIEGGAGSDLIYGGDGNDTIYGFGADDTNDDGSGDTIFGGAGDDLIYGNGGNDTIEGNDGNDTIHGGAGSDLLFGNDGNDTIYGFGPDDALDDHSSDEIYGGEGDDILYGNGGDDLIFGGNGNDQIFGGSGNDLIFGENGDDYIEGGAGSDEIYGGEGNDTIYGFGADDTNDDGSGDTIFGGTGDDLIYGNGGNDYIEGNDGNDTIYGGAGDDTIDGGAGDDLIFGNEGRDLIWGRDGDDVIYGGDGNDWIDAGDGNDTVYGGAGDDTIYGGPGDDNIFGEAGDDLLFGGAGNDSLDGGPGDDVLYGEDGDDFLNGGDGNDALYGGAGVDILRGGSGDDYLFAGSGVGNELYGEGGNDILVGSDFGGESDPDFFDSERFGDLLDGGPGDDRIYGMGGADLIFGGAGNDWIDSGSGADWVDAGEGDDFVFAGHGGGDQIFGGPGDDQLWASPDGATTIDGGSGNDVIRGGSGNDSLSGGSGSDDIDGGGGSDTIDGGPGDDTLRAGSGTGNLLNGGAGNDILIGSSDGNGTLNGGDGSNVFYLSPGDTHDASVDDLVSDSGAAPFPVGQTIDPETLAETNLPDSAAGPLYPYAPFSRGSADGWGASRSPVAAVDPALAIASDGTTYLAWADGRAGVFQILVAAHTESLGWHELDGSAQGAGISGTAGSSRSPELALLANGSLMVAWVEHDLDPLAGLSIQYSIWDGSAWSTSGVVATTGSAVAMKLRATASGAVLGVNEESGDLHIYSFEAGNWNLDASFTGVSDGFDLDADGDLLALVVSDGETTSLYTGTSTNLTLDASTEGSLPAVSWFAGDPYLAVADRSGIAASARRLEWFRWDGSNLLEVSTGAAFGDVTAIELVAGGGRLHLVWNEDGAATRQSAGVITYALWTDGTTVYEPLEGLSTDGRGVAPSTASARDISLAVAADGTAVLALNELGYGANIHLRRFIPAATDNTTVISGSSGETLVIGPESEGRVFYFTPESIRPNVEVVDANNVALVNAPGLGLLRTGGNTRLTIENSSLDFLRLEGGTEIELLNSIVDAVEIRDSSSGLFERNTITRMEVLAPFVGSIRDNIFGGGATAIRLLAPAPLVDNRIENSEIGIEVAYSEEANALGYYPGSGQNLIRFNEVGIWLRSGQVVGQKVSDNEVGSLVVGANAVFGPRYDDWDGANLLKGNQTGVQLFNGAVQFNRFTRNETAIEASGTQTSVEHNLFDRNGTAWEVSGVGNRFVSNTVLSEDGDGVIVVEAEQTFISDNIFLIRGSGTAITVLSFGSFASDYNLFHVEDGAAIYDWTRPFYDILDVQADIGRFELHSLGTIGTNPFWSAPRLVSPALGDLRPIELIGRLRTTSPARDNARSFSDLGRDPGETNLLANPTFETGTTGWTVNDSALTATANLPWDAGAYLDTGVDRLGSAVTTVDLLASGIALADLDDRSLAAVFGGRIRAAGDLQGVTSFDLSLRFLDDSNTLLAEEVLSVRPDDLQWVLAGGRVVLPVGVRYVEYRFDVEVEVSGESSGQLDGAFLFLQENAYAPDIGAFGRTSVDLPSSDPRIALRFPDIYTDWERDRPREILWETYGNVANQPIDIDLYQNGVFLLQIASGAPDNGSYRWIPFDDSGIDFGTYGLQVHVSIQGVPGAYDQAAESFTVPEDGSVYYVNVADDPDLSDNLFTNAAGSNRQTGKLASAPKPNPVNVLRVYELKGGDELLFDPGNYELLESIFVSGASPTPLGLDNGFILQGAGSTASTFEDRITFGQRDAINMSGSTVVGLMDFGINGFETGIVADATSVNLTLEDLLVVGAGNGMRIDGSSIVELQRVEVRESFGDGIILTGFYEVDLTDVVSASNQGSGLSASAWQAKLNVSGGEYRDNAADGIVITGLSFSSPALISGAAFAANGEAGIRTVGGLTVESSVFTNNSVGLRSSETVNIQGSVFADNQFGITHGIGSIFVDASIISGSQRAMGTENSLSSVANVTNSELIGNGVGIIDFRNTSVTNSVVASSSRSIKSLESSNSSITVDSSTIVSSGGDFAIEAALGTVDMNDSILSFVNGKGIFLGPSTSYSGDYNLWDAGPVVQVSNRVNSLEGWRSLTNSDLNSFVANPIFVDPTGGNYRLQSTIGTWDPVAAAFAIFGAQSPAIDRANPIRSIGDEVTPNGGLRNLGAYGGTAQASQSPISFILPIQPKLNSTVFQGQTIDIEWLSSGVVGAVEIALSPSGVGGVFSPIVASTPNDGSYAWLVDGSLPPGNNYALRITSLDDPSVIALVSPFSISAPVSNYYVNIAGDTNLLDNLYTTAAGSDANDGLTPGTPMASIGAVLNAYSLKAGDVILVDTGTYTNTSTLLIGSDDAGVEIRGAGSSTVLNYTSTGVAVRILDAPGSLLTNLRVIGNGEIGVEIAGQTLGAVVDGVEVSGFRRGVQVNATTSGTTIRGAIISNAEYGIDSKTADLVVESSTISRTPTSTRARFAGIHVIDPAGVGLELRQNSVSGYNFESLSVSYNNFGFFVQTGGYLVQDNLSEDNTIGFWLDGSGDSIGNTASGSGRFGFHLAGGGLHQSNQAELGSIGFRSDATFIGTLEDSTAVDNTIGLLTAGGTFRGNEISVPLGNRAGSIGIAIDAAVNRGGNRVSAGASLIEGNRVHGTGIGIAILHGLTVRSFGPISVGDLLQEDGTAVVVGNLVYGTSGPAVFSDGLDFPILFRHNTFVPLTGVDAVHLTEATENVRFDSNIFSVHGAGVFALRVDDGAQRGFASDFNLFDLTSGAGAVFWQGGFADPQIWWLESGQDRSSRIGDPLFNDPGNFDFTLDLGSAARDGANPETGRRNQGAFDDLLDGPSFRFLNPDDGDKLIGGENLTIEWISLGTNSGTILLEISLDGGSSWDTLASVADTGSYSVALPIPSAPVFDALIRISDLADPTNSLTTSFTLGMPTSTFYVAPGGLYTNTGTTASDPLPSLAAVIHAYAPRGATVELAEGLYQTVVALEISEGTMVIGPAILDRGNLSEGSVLLKVSEMATFENLTLRGAGIALEISGEAEASGVRIESSELGGIVSGSLSFEGGVVDSLAIGFSISGVATFSGSQFTDNGVGLILLEGAIVDLNDSVLLGNQIGADLTGGAILSGGLYLTSGEAAVRMGGGKFNQISGATFNGGSTAIAVVAVDGTQTVRNSLFVNVDTAIVSGGSLSSKGILTVANNTFIMDAGTALEATNTFRTRLANNIFTGSGSFFVLDVLSAGRLVSDYNLFAPGFSEIGVLGGAPFLSLFDWRSITGRDLNSLVAEPQFVDPLNGDYRLSPGSPAVDRGDPASDSLGEPDPNGGRVNLGAFGGTASATPSPSPSIQIVSPQEDARLVRGSTVEIQWNTVGLSALYPNLRYLEAILENDPIAYFPFGATVGSFVPDYAGNPASYDLTPANGVTGGLGDPFGGNGAFSFDGVDDSLTGSVVPNLETGPLSITAWIFAETDLANNAFLVGYGDPNFFAGYHLYYDSTDGSLVFDAADDLFGTEPVVRASLPLGRWVHLVATIDGLEMRIYLDGVKAGEVQRRSEAIALNLSNPSRIAVGSPRASGGVTWKGGIDQVAFFDKALSAAEVAALYEARLPVTGTSNVSLTLSGEVEPFAVALDRGSFLWTVPETLAEGIYTIEASVSGATVVSKPFQVVNAGNVYYINDAVVDPGELATAPGDDANSGQSPDAPMANLSSLLAVYDLGPGDLVHIGVGTYLVNDSIRIGLENSGVTLRGPDPEVGIALFDRANRSQGTTVFTVSSAEGVTIEYLHVTGAEYGIDAYATEDLTLREMVIFENRRGGLRVDSNSGHTTVVDSIFRGIGSDVDRDQTIQVEIRGASTLIRGSSVNLTGLSNLGIRSANQGIFVNVSGESRIIGNTVFNVASGFSITSDGGEVSGNLSRDNGSGFYIGNDVFLFLGASYTQIFGNQAVNNERDGFVLYGVVEAYQNEARENDIGFKSVGGANANFSRIGVVDTRGGNVAAFNRIGILSFHDVVAQNVTYGNSEDGIRLGSLTNHTLVSNRSFSNGGFGIGSVDGRNADLFSVIVENNLVYDNGLGGISYTTTTIANFAQVVRNNTVVQDSGIGIRIFNDARNLTLTNNIVVIRAGVAFEAEQTFAAGTVWDYNLIHLATSAAQFARVGSTTYGTLGQWQIATGLSAHSFLGDPLFIDPDGPDNVLGYDAVSGVYGGDDDLFLLRAGSPAIDAGESLDAPGTDFFFNGRADDPGTTNQGSPSYLISHPATGSVFDLPLGGGSLGMKGINPIKEVVLPFSFPFYDTTRDRLWVGNNGMLQLTNSSTSANATINSVTALASFPRIAPLWDYLQTNFEDDVYYEEFADRVVFRWEATTNALPREPVNVAVTLWANGQIRFDYGPGNLNLTPTVGISNGSNNIRNLFLTDADGLSSLTNHPSTLFTPGPGIYDIGAFEFGGSSLDVTPPTITGSNPSPIFTGVGTVSAATTRIDLVLSEPLNPLVATSTIPFQMVEAGADGTFGTEDDVAIAITPSYQPGSTILSLNLNTQLGFGLFRLTLSGNDIYDLNGIPLAGDGLDEGTDFIREFAAGAEVLQALIAYAGASADNGAANLEAVLASQKVPLRPGEHATFANVSTYSRGINAVAVDLTSPAGAILPEDFIFATGNTQYPEGWATAPAPVSIHVVEGAGSEGSNRVVIRWADNLIQNQWLKLVIRPTDLNGLQLPQTFYFGHQHGDIGIDDGNGSHFLVGSEDRDALLANFTGSAITPGGISPMDLNRDGRINAIDFARARSGENTVETALVILQAPRFEGEARVVGRFVGALGTIFPEKTALMPGGTATFANYTSSPDGLVEISFDLAHAAPGINLSQINLTTGNDQFPEGWGVIVNATSLIYLPGGGIDGSNRVRLSLAPGSVVGRWLSVSVDAHATTGLVHREDFYFGNQPGDAGIPDLQQTHFLVGSEDAAAVLEAFSPTPGSVATGNPLDFNRDGRINAIDFATAREGKNDPSTALVRLKAPLVDFAARIVARYTGDNSSFYDGYDSELNAADQGGISPGLAALQNGSTANRSNLSGAVSGITTIVVDFAHSVSGIALSDFGFRVGNSENLAGWLAAPVPTAWTYLEGAGVGGSNRIILGWSSGTLLNTWLEVTVRATAGTGLLDDDVFYFGSLVGETGDDDLLTVGDGDLNGILANFTAAGETVSAAAKRFDINRDGKVNALDYAMARGSAGNQLVRLNLK